MLDEVLWFNFMFSRELKYCDALQIAGARDQDRIGRACWISLFASLSAMAAIRGAQSHSLVLGSICNGPTLNFSALIVHRFHRPTGGEGLFGDSDKRIASRQLTLLSVQLFNSPA